MLPQIQQKPGYMGFLPETYQTVRCKQDPSLDQVLAINAGVASTSQPTIQARIRTPNVRCRARVSFVLVPDPALGPNVDTSLNTTVITGTASVWVALRTATRGAALKAPPTRNVVGTGAGPLPFPTDTRLWGYEFEIETNGEEMLARFVPPQSAAANAIPYTWRLIVAYEAVVPLSSEEWNQFIQGYGIEAVAQALT